MPHSGLLNLRSVIPVVYIRTIVDQWSKNISQKHNYICMYNSVPTTCFGRFLTGHHQVGYNVGGTTYLLKYSHWWQCECGVRGGTSHLGNHNLLIMNILCTPYCCKRDLVPPLTLYLHCHQWLYLSGYVVPPTLYPTWWWPVRKRPKHVVGTLLYIQI